MRQHVAIRVAAITLIAHLVISLFTLAHAAESDISSSTLRDAIRAAHFAEPLVSTKPTSAEEDRSLMQALSAYQQRTSASDFESLTSFVAGNPRSGWAPALLTNLGLAYLHDGYFSRALDAWQAAWREGKEATEPTAKALVDRAVGELARLYASLGKNEELAALFNEIGNRPVSGPATEALQTAREELVLADKDPRHLFKCGPLALRALMLSQGVSNERVDFLQWYRASKEGTNLAEVGKLADDAKFDRQIVFRKPGQAVPLPAIVHWKVGHFATILEQANGRYRIQDPVFFGGDLWVTQAALDAEASGYFLVPKAVAPSVGLRGGKRHLGKGADIGDSTRYTWTTGSTSQSSARCE